jgi:hypothetical protein
VPVYEAPEGRTSSHYRRRTLLGGGALVGAGLLLTGGRASASPGPTADSSFGTPTSDANMRQLEAFAGSWHAEGTKTSFPAGTPVPIVMRIDVSFEQRGFWLHQVTTELRTPQNPDPLSARYIWGWDAQRGQFVADWFDSTGGRARQYSPGWQGNVFVFAGSITSNGQTIPLRDTFTRRNQNEYRHIGELDFGSGWIPVDEEDVVRRSH